mgnify:CR=1 FL=1
MAEQIAKESCFFLGLIFVSCRTGNQKNFVLFFCFGCEFILFYFFQPVTNSNVAVVVVAKVVKHKNI